jgi:hypothetical protein
MRSPTTRPTATTAPARGIAERQGARPEQRRCDRGELVAAACNLLEAGERTVAGMPDAVLALRTRRLISYAVSVPAAVLAASYHGEATSERRGGHAEK